VVVDEDDKGLGEETLSKEASGKEASGKEASGKDVLGSVSGCLGCIGQVLLVFFTYFLGNQGPRLDPSHWPGPMKAAMLWFNPSSASMTLETPDGVGVTVSGDRMGPTGVGITTVRIDHWARRTDCDAMPGSFEIAHSSIYAWIRRSPGPNGTVSRYTSKRENCWGAGPSGATPAAGAEPAPPQNSPQVPRSVGWEVQGDRRL